ncbi:MULTISPECIES: ATP12 family protein [Rhodopseudomonas]|uniref:ATPase n=1 Tax=Rhodopseudomonas palustris TaxID=1076 RepID=A0A0D7F479_RHOPL|nr:MULTISPECIES: ATP12 family protein [Rhodopseudomonas]KIZ47606.1 ATPase [Rhodopseudomonas palustris]MDF3809407.1 ATP12 family protein [Rhodopseudomonas sp. BAL398]WOK18566.1 ATP12 family protein [Rhodopseudomonas sp. BAL398]
MRELFDDVTGRSPLDPEETVRRSTRGPQLKRFYAEAGVAETAEGFAITLDGKQVKTPSRRTLAAPDRALAEAIAAEWQAQSELINPMTMPLTRLANSVLDAVVDRVDAVTDDVAQYFESDLLFYRASHPQALVAREAEHWDPVLFWAAQTLGAHFILAEGIVHVRQPESAVAAVRAALPREPWSIAAFHVVTTITGSALLTLALTHGARDPDQVWAAAHVDEDWNIGQWGLDEEVAARRAAKHVDFAAAARVLAMRAAPSS